jgi:hypothetical protein
MVKSATRTFKRYFLSFRASGVQQHCLRALPEATQMKRFLTEKLSWQLVNNSQKSKAGEQRLQRLEIRKYKFIYYLAFPVLASSSVLAQAQVPFVTGKTLGTAKNTMAAPTSANADEYLRLAQNYSLAAGMEYRYGTPSNLSNDGFPTQYKPADRFFDNRGNGNGWDYQVGSQDLSKNDYFSNHAQFLFVPDASTHPGVTVLQTVVMAEGTVSEKPMIPWVYYGGGDPDVDIARPNYVSTNGGALRQPTAVAHSYGMDTWSANSLVAFQSGLIAAFGTNTSRGEVAVKLAAGKVPTAIAITSNNEFALVTVWDTNQRKGQVAVLAMGTGNDFWGDWTAVYPGLRNKGLYTFMKILGYVDLPGMTQPTEISASADYTCSSDDNDGWLVSPDGRDRRYQENQLILSNEANRQSFIVGGNQGRYPRGGFAVISSKGEKKVAFLDLKPLFEQMHKMYFTTRSNFLLTQNLGMQDDQWPFTFNVAPGSAPTVAKVVSMAQPPTAVRSSVVPGANKAYVATQDGTLHLFNVGGYGTANGGSPNEIAEVGSVAVGSNPTSIAYCKNKGFDNDPNTGFLGKQLIVCSRGERAIKWVQLNGNTATVIKTLRDTRLQDPVWVEDNDNHGTEAAIITVADYGGRQIINYRYGPVIYHTNGGARYGMGANGQSEFECGGAYPVLGRPFQVSGTNVP